MPRHRQERFTVTPQQTADLAAAVAAEPPRGPELVPEQRQVAATMLARLPSGPPVLGPDTGPTPAWSQRLLARAAEAPEYGSPAWEALADDDPAKVAATVAAAEAWRRSTTPEAIADRLTLELSAARHAEEVELERAQAVALRNVAAAVPSGPSYAQLSDLRGEPERAAAARASEARRGLPVSPPLQHATR